MFLNLNKLVELFAFSSLVCEYVKDMICTNVQHFLKDYVDDFAHPCISLLKCLYISHPFFFAAPCSCCKTFVFVTSCFASLLIYILLHVLVFEFI